MFPVSVLKIFKIAMRKSVVESLFSKVTCKISAFYNYVENCIKCTDMFQEVALLEISRNSSLTGVANFYRNTTGIYMKKKYELLTTFPKDILKISIYFQEEPCNKVSLSKF